ncbi:MAG TPA: 1,4-dihydroxy-2-naphthoate polyprenyltransferase [candidate division Zixibacteria bacterium]|nr:1,4-dihydroxy-2-naphthoate polyprenyltransferase [candidate division Zixibacteria bacterium]HOZ06693.1 1,4-dihydroxy-2-naphthoate polyprenyltransferase [candidate division Zixibacteria bacterium]HPI32316.1 1,4-dihydroxy-2-naphthoate polyprenyltransferase [candidate division Zixibacteria bacterium]
MWLLAARPKTLFASAAPVVMGTAMAAEAGAFHLWSALAALAGALLIQIGTNFANDYSDFKSGADAIARVGPIRVTQAGLVTPGAMKAATALVFGLAVLCGAYLVYRGGWPVTVIGLSSVLWGILYTAGPYPLGYIGLADLFVFVYFGPVAVGGTYYVQTLAITPPVLVAGAGTGLFSVAILTVNNLRDIESDRRAGKRTLAARFGRTFAQWEYVLAVAIAAGIPAALALLTEGHSSAIIASLTILPALAAFRTIRRATDGPTLNRLLATTGKLLLLYSLLFSIGWWW